MSIKTLALLSDLPASLATLSSVHSQSYSQSTASHSFFRHLLTLACSCLSRAPPCLRNVPEARGTRSSRTALTTVALTNNRGGSKSGSRWPSRRCSVLSALAPVGCSEQRTPYKRPHFRISSQVVRSVPLRRGRAYSWVLNITLHSARHWHIPAAGDDPTSNAGCTSS